MACSHIHYVLRQFCEAAQGSDAGFRSDFDSGEPSDLFQVTQQFRFQIPNTLLTCS